MVDHTTEAERLAREMCFEICSKGGYLDYEAGCVSTCKSVSECQTWRSHVHKIKPKKEAPAPTQNMQQMDADTRWMLDWLEQDADVCSTVNGERDAATMEARRLETTAKKLARQVQSQAAQIATLKAELAAARDAVLVEAADILEYLRDDYDDAEALTALDEGSERILALRSTPAPDPVGEAARVLLGELQRIEPASREQFFAVQAWLQRRLHDALAGEGE